MGVNMVGYAITDDAVVREATKQEVVRRYYKAYNDYKLGLTELDTAHRVEILMKDMGAKPTDRAVVGPALKKAAESGCPAIALELPDGKILTGRDKNNLYASLCACGSDNQRVKGACRHRRSNKANIACGYRRGIKS